MSSTGILEMMRLVPGLRHGDGVSLEEVRRAEAALGMTFPEAYVDLLLTYGWVRVCGEQWMGLGGGPERDVVRQTLRERLAHPEQTDLQHCFVITRQQEGLLEIVSEQGKVWYCRGEQRIPAASSQTSYLAICMDL